MLEFITSLPVKEALFSPSSNTWFSGPFSMSFFIILLLLMSTTFKTNFNVWLSISITSGWLPSSNSFSLPYFDIQQLLPLLLILVSATWLYSDHISLTWLINTPSLYCLYGNKHINLNITMIYLQIEDNLICEKKKKNQVTLWNFSDSGHRLISEYQNI